MISANYSDITCGTIHANNFELESALIQNQFGDAATSDPNMHQRTFLEIVDMVKINGVTDNTIRLCLFLFSLRNQARSWLQSLSSWSIDTWEDMTVNFWLNNFDLPSLSNSR